MAETDPVSETLRLKKLKMIDTLQSNSHISTQSKRLLAEHQRTAMLQSSTEPFSQALSLGADTM
jgi:hypothetical protein